MSPRLVFTLPLLLSIAACVGGTSNSPVYRSGSAGYDQVYGIPEGYNDPGYGGPGATGEAPPMVNRLP
jgi:hypothetical protein